MLDKCCIVFDLDDTLYNEVEFIKSGYRYINKLVKKQFGIQIKYTPNKKQLIQSKTHIQFYIKKNKINFLSEIEILGLIRNHKPTIKLSSHVLGLLSKLKKKNVTLCIVTDGRSITQNNKVNSLSLRDYFDYISISEEIGFEKTNQIVFKKIMEKFPKTRYFYIADNENKDFIAPKKLNWLTIGIRNKSNRIHKINFNNSKNLKPHIYYDNINEINLLNLKKLI
ncbi:MAG: HAD family hydrolase [Alphaproteobacteria bacterium]|jgi:putative hydrolase of the HAD superfamily|nr:HAD family hydrolase [Alphaproteobacteria bacterium]